jgi:hypothetical protein
MKFSIDPALKRLFNEVLRGLEALHEYQHTAKNFLRDNPFSALFIDLGLGKTIIVATLIAELLDEGDWGPWLIIAPKRVARQTWPHEFKEWRHIAHISNRSPFDKQYRKALKDAAKLKVDFERKAMLIDEPDFVRPGTRKQEAAFALFHDTFRKKLALIGKQERERVSHIEIKKAFARNPAIVHIINREQLEHLVAAWGPNRWPYLNVAIDESQSFKNHKSGRFEAMKAVLYRLKRLHLLTATPAAETYEDLFAQMYLLDRGKRLGTHITHYRERYFRRNRSGYNWKLFPGMEKEIAEKIADICLTMKARDYLDLKEPKTIPVKVHLSPDMMRAYRRAAREAVIHVEEKTITGETAAALQQKLMQIASGFVYDEKKKAYDLHNAKIETLQEIVEEANGQPILVSYWHNASRERLKKAFPKAVVMDPDGKCVKDWNAGKIKMMLVQPQSAGAGLNLQHGGHILVVFDMFFSNELYTQLVGRLARQGQKDLVLVYLLMAVGTVDEIARVAVIDKEAGQQLLFKLLEEIRAAVHRGEDIPDYEFDDAYDELMTENLDL